MGRKGTRRCRITLYRRQFGLCDYCGKLMLDPTKDNSPRLSKHPDLATIDHVRPLSQGGERGNIGGMNNLLVCHECNLAKGAKSLIIFMAQLHKSIC